MRSDIDNMCECEMIRKDGLAPPSFGSYGWVYTLKKDNKGWWYILINHGGSQEEIPIAFCPYCGKYLK
jgi:hypothetical protein